MKLADIDWVEVLDALPRWEALSADAREAFIRIKPGTATEARALGTARDELVAAGFVTPPGPKGRMYPHAPELRLLLVALRTMDRLRPLDAPGGTLAETYFQDQLAGTETNALLGEVSYRWVDHRAAAALVSSAEWLKEFLAARPGIPLVTWEQARTVHGERQRLVSPLVAHATRALVQALVERPTGVPLSSLPELLPNDDPHTRAAALAAALRYLLAFVSLRGRGHDAVLGILPSVATRLGPPPPPPAAVPALDAFEAPFRIADMTAVLVEAATEPIPVRGADGSLYVRARKAIGARLLRLPEWAAELVAVHTYQDDEGEDDDAQVEFRVAVAVEFLSQLKLARVGHAKERYQFAATPAGRAWLARAEGERLKGVLDALRESSQRNPGWWHTQGESVDFFGVQLPFTVDETMDLRTPLAAAFLSLPAEGVVPLDAFLRYHAEAENPLLAPGSGKPRRSGVFGRPPTRDGWEGLWRQLLTGFLLLRLVPLGGARIARTGQGIALGLTDAGRYLLGGTDHFHYAPPADGEVVVQPDFEIVFLAPAPRVEAELARFAERTGAGVGALFRLTRASVLRAAEQGLTAEQVLKSLARVSRIAVPPNVTRQVKDWFGGTRRVRIAPAVLVECPDTETAARVTALAGAQATPVTRTILRLQGDSKTVNGLVKKLRAKGIFVSQ